jgi:hypothetical protein
LWDPAPCYGDFKAEHRQARHPDYQNSQAPLLPYTAWVFLGIVKVYNVIYLTLLLLFYLNIVCTIIPEIAGDWS